MEARGFIVSAWEERRRSGGRILMTGRLEDARSFAMIVPAPRPVLFVAEQDGAAALACLRAKAPRSTAVLGAETWWSLSGTALARLEMSPEAIDAADRRLLDAGIAVASKARPRADETLLSLGILGPVHIRGEARPGRRVDAVFIQPELAPAQTTAALAWLAIDLETDREQHVVAASLAGAGGPGEVLFLGEDPGDPSVTAYPTEGALLQALAKRLVARDPDVITGWNVIDFDLRVLAKRFAAQGLKLDLGRTEEGATFEERENGSAVVRVPGRAVLDAMRLVRGSGERFDDLSLEAVARDVLGEGKTVATRGLAKVEELKRLRREDPGAFCAYCLRDSELVLRILAKTGLDVLSAKRAALTGVSLELAWTSIPAFERIYAAELRARRVVPPPRTPRTVSGAAGGTVLDASPGLFPNVLVLDFRSLYPSIMRTFNIDPLAQARAEARAPSSDDLVAPNGARFDRALGCLPGIIARSAEERAAALARGDETAAYVYKILQNSFYGVLGAEGCRYARTDLAGAITSFGKLFLTAARDFFEERGLRVLYGDTDSVFVLSGLGDETGFAGLTGAGAKAVDELNALMAERIEREYRVTSHLSIRCEKVYRRFFIPRLRGDTSSDGRGRAKGYAGLRLGADGTSVLEVRGLEAARSDFTPLARRFQTELLSRVFAGEGEEQLSEYCRDVIGRMQRGELDAELVYRKSLRRPAREYDSETPQVRAARMLGWTGQRGRISYVMTRAGADPIDARSDAPLDYEHYLAKQLYPMAASVGDALGWTARRWFGDSAQLELFETSGSEELTCSAYSPWKRPPTS